MGGKISLSIGELQWKFGIKEAIKIAKEAGAEAVDFNLGGRDYRGKNDIYSKSDEEITEYYNDIRKYADSIGMEIGQTHGRLRSGFREGEETAAAIENARRDLLATSALGVKVSVFHYINSYRMGIHTPVEEMRSKNFEIFNQIFAFAREYNVKIAAETFGNLTEPEKVIDFYGNINEFTAMYDRLSAIDGNEKYSAACMDVGHTNCAVMYGQPSAGDVIRILGSRIAVLHLHDNNGAEDQHHLPFSGTIDWKDVFDALDEIGYSGNYNMEIKFDSFGKGIEKETAAFAVTAMRNFLNNR